MPRQRGVKEPCIYWERQASLLERRYVCMCVRVCLLAEGDDEAGEVVNNLDAMSHLYFIH